MATPEFDMPAFRTWAEMIKNEIILIKQRLTEIEKSLEEGGVGKPATGKLMTGYYTPTGEPYKEYDMSAFQRVPERDDLVAMLVLTMQARRALYGYGMLLRQMGLPKEYDQVMRKIEITTSAVLRLIQTIKMLQFIQSIGFFTPMGGVYSIVAMGTLAATIGYTNRLGGAGV